MSWTTVHCGSRIDIECEPQLAHEEYEREPRWEDRRPWTCNGPGPLVEEFRTAAGQRDSRTVEECPSCNGGSHRDYRRISLEQRAGAA